MKNFWNSQVISAIVGSVATYILGKLDTVKTDWAWNWIPGWATAVSTWFTQPAISPMYLLLAGFALIILKRVFDAWNHPTTEEPENAWLQYRSDRIDGLQWKWQWVQRGSRYDVDYLRAFCPRCNYPLVWTKSGFHALGYNALLCEECEYHQQMDYEHKDVENRVRRRIAHTIETDTIPASVA